MSQGGLQSPDGTLGAIKVYGGADLQLTNQGNHLDGNLTVGDGTTPGTVQLGGLQTDVVDHGGNILVTPTGTFQMNQEGDTSTASKGGIDQTGAASPGTFTNQGVFVRSGVTSGPWITQLNMVFINSGAFAVRPGSSLNFTQADKQGYSLYNHSGGVVTLDYGSSGAQVKGTGKYLQDGGIFGTQSLPEAGGTGQVSFLLKSEFVGGSVQPSSDSGYSTVYFGNNDVTLGNSVTVYLHVDGSSQDPNEQGDQLKIDTASQLTIDNSGTNKPSLVITTDNAQPAAGWQFDLMIAPNLVGSFAAGNVTYQGSTPAGGYTLSYPFGPPRSVRIKV
jgi:hypothetical protein